VNKDYVCSVKKGHLFSGSVSDQASPPQCCGKPMIPLNAGTPKSEATTTLEQVKKKK
jgi:hypothetical protein